MSKITNSKNHESRDGRRQHSEELHGLYCSPNINLVIKSGRMTWTEHVVCAGRGEMRTDRILQGSPEVKRPPARPRCR